MSMVAFRGKSRVGTPVLAGRREQAVAPARLSNVVNLTVLARPALARGRPLSSGTPMGLTPMGLLASLPAPDFALLRSRPNIVRSRSLQASQKIADRVCCRRAQGPV